MGGTLYKVMKKTSVYLTEEEAEGLRRMALGSGRAQAEIIREGIRRIVGEPGLARQFRSLGKGHGGGQPYTRWASRDLYKKAMGQR
jgi:Ribbon-helix-helix protein, copG family